MTLEEIRHIVLHLKSAQLQLVSNQSNLATFDAF